MDQVPYEELAHRLQLAREALREAEARATAGRLALELMHEIRNPLEALGHVTYLAREEAEDSAKVRSYMHIAEEQMATVSQIVSQTLGFAQTAGAPQSVDLLQVTEAALRIHQRTIEAKKVRLSRTLSDGMISSVHRGELLQVLSNLLHNALDAMQMNGQLHLRLKKCHGMIHIIIADDGHGISSDHCSKIFDPFFTTKAGKGTGLGLSLSKQIIDKHHGVLKMRSSLGPDRRGTTFRISLPA